MMHRARIALSLSLFVFVLLAAVVVQAESEPADQPDASDTSTEEAPAPSPTASGPYLWAWGGIGGGAFNSGLMGKIRVQLRHAALRNDSVLFQSTFVGAGLEVMLTPAFVHVGPRFSFRPVEVLDIDAHLLWMHVWKSSAGLLPFDQLTGTYESDRKAIKHLALVGNRLEAIISPTFKFKVGPVIGLWNAEWAFIHHLKPSGATSRYTYEPMRDLVVAWNDVAVSNLAAILVEVLDGTGPKGGPQPTLRFGPAMRDKQTVVSRDMSTAVGGAISFKPGPKPGWPSVFLAVMGYVRDNDRRFKEPQIQVQISWELEKSLKKKDPAMEAVAALKSGGIR